MAQRVAIVGTGMAGAACAAALAERGQEVVLFEAEADEAVGGRLAQRRVGEARFDHGAQYIRARDPDFQAAVRGWAAAGIVARWSPGDAPDLAAWCGVPSMRAPVEALLDGLEARLGWRVDGLRRTADGWHLMGARGRTAGPFAGVVLAIPAAEALALLGSAAPVGWPAALGAVAMAPCWALMAAFAEAPGVSRDCLRPAAGPLAWVASQVEKPGRGPVETWIAHARPDWSLRHIGERPAAVAPLLLEAMEAAFGRALPAPAVLEAHRWPFALVQRPLGRDFLLDRAAGLAVCGDWCLGPRVEAAFLSGRRLGEALAA